MFFNILRGTRAVSRLIPRNQNIGKLINNNIARKRWYSKPAPENDSIATTFNASQEYILKRLNINTTILYSGLTGIGLLGVGMYVYSDDIKEIFGTHTADVAGRTLRNETTKQEAKDFLHNLLDDNELKETVTQVFSQVVIDTVKKEEVQNQFLELLTWAVSTPQAKDKLKQLIYSLYDDPEFVEFSRGFVLQVISADYIQEQVTEILSTSVKDMATDPDYQRMLADNVWIITKDSITPRYFRKKIPIPKKDDDPP